ncbi:putative transcription factor C2H2 family [Helianthus annuus]|nr:putative transcription factor C2H2 family [Helianthus annuus]
MDSEPDRSLPALIERLMPLFASFSTTGPDSSPEQEPDRVVLINPLTQHMGMMNELRKPGQPPASQASIDGLPTTEIKRTDEIESLGGECVICLEELKVGDVVSEMPCEHKYHCGCLKKWLKIHGSCPVCRFKMPVDGSGEKVRGEVWVGLVFGGGVRRESEGLES